LKGTGPVTLRTLLPNAVALWARRLGWAWAALVVVATGVVLVRRSTPVTPPVTSTERALPTGARVDLADHARGAVIAVSSYLSIANHHPLFAIDARRSTHPLAKWVSAKSDRAPWLEVRWPTPVDVDEVRLVHAGSAEDDAYTIARYTLRCLDAAGALLARADVSDNRADVVSHPLACAGASTLRIDFEVEALDSPRGVVRIYEVEALGTLPDAARTAP
jgi:hypothetical protein